VLADIVTLHVHVCAIVHELQETPDQEMVPLVDDVAVSVTTAVES
jgi:hypothetical protein